MVTKKLTFFAVRGPRRLRGVLHGKKSFCPKKQKQNKKQKKTQKNTKVRLFPCNMEKNTTFWTKWLFKKIYLTSKMVFMSNENVLKVIFLFLMSNENLLKVIFVQKVVFDVILHGNKLTFCVFLVFLVFWFFGFFGQNNFFPCNSPLRQRQRQDTWGRLGAVTTQLPVNI